MRAFSSLSIIPNLTVNVDRTRAESVGLTQQNVAQSLLVALSGSFQTTPNFYLDPRNGVSYNIAVQAPQYRLDTMAELQSLPVTSSASAAATSGTMTGAASTAAPGSAAAAQMALTGAALTAAPGAIEPCRC